MIKKYIKTEKKVVEEKDIVVREETLCDRCNKILSVSDKNNKHFISTVGKKDKKWYEVIYYSEYDDYHSPTFYCEDCVKKQIDDYLKRRVKYGEMNIKLIGYIGEIDEPSQEDLGYEKIEYEH